MSGIAAIIHFDGGPVDNAAIQRMTEAMIYRGPDGTNHFLSGSAALGACMMHTSAEEQVASEPCSNEDASISLVLDGYVANHAELRRELLQRGAHLRNRSDAELVLRALETWGKDCARNIDGEFAFIAWDARTRSLHCARDHAGLRPLFYYRREDLLVMASDFAAIRKGARIELEPNPEVLVQIAANQHYFTDQTVWRVIRRVMPAHGMRFDRSGQREWRYWHLPERYSIRHASDDEYAEHYREVLSESVRQASRTDRTLAVEVSGGLDSSAVFASADQLYRNARLQAPQIAGFALEGPRDSPADELRFTQAVEEHLSIPIHRQPLHIPPFDRLLAQAQRDADIPYFPNAVMMTGMYRTMAQSGCRVALNGLGGDEWLNGHPSLFLESLLHHDWRQIVRSAKALEAAFGKTKAARAFWKFGLRPWLGGSLHIALRQGAGRYARTRLPETPWLSSEGRELLRRSAQQHLDAKSSHDSRMSAPACPLPMTLVIMEHASRLRAQCGIEGRHPLFSKRFVEFSAATPLAMRLRGSQQKYVHRLAMRGLLPEVVLTRTSKAEFSTTLEAQIGAIEGFWQLQAYGLANDLIEPSGLRDLLTAARQGNLDSYWK